MQRNSPKLGNYFLRGTQATKDAAWILQFEVAEFHQGNSFYICINGAMKLLSNAVNLKELINFLQIFNGDALQVYFTKN